MADQSKKTFDVKWRVENIRPWLQLADDSLYSPRFLAETLANTRWRLKLTRKCQMEENYISVAIERDMEDDHQKPIDLNYELSFLTCDGSAIKSKSCTTKFALSTVSQELKVAGTEILGENKEAYLPGDVLAVRCKMSKAWSAMSKGGECKLRSVIGKKCVTLEEISFLSFDVYRHSNDRIKFERTEVKCKCFSNYSCKLYVLYNGEQPLECVASQDLKTLLSSHTSCSFNLHYGCESFRSAQYLKNDRLTLQIDVSYNPGVESEYIEYDYDNYGEKQNAVLEKVNASKAEDVNDSVLDSLHTPEPEDKTCVFQENDSDDEDECFCAAGKRSFSTTTLKEDLASLYSDRLFCDTKLQTDTETFPAHRSVLSARSPVFKKMFTTDMKEKAGECISVPDISSDTVRRMLQFLYTDRTGHLDMQIAKDLYIASDKYDIASLKKRCSLFMKKHLCPVNVCEIIVLADMHQDKDLESAAHEFVLTYDKEVFVSDEWKLFMKDYSSLAARVMYLKCLKG